MKMNLRIMSYKLPVIINPTRAAESYRLSRLSSNDCGEAGPSWKKGDAERFWIWDGQFHTILRGLDGGELWD